MLGKDYRVLDRIGAGGMAVVYLVEHQTLLKRFAAKVLSTEHASSAEARARFTQEAHAASQLDHENIVSISDFGLTADNRPYFVMELLRGQTLAERLDDRPMTLGEVVAVAVPVARALAHAHAEDIIHRDVKPENIFLVQRSQGRWGVKVLDFGIARVPVNDRMTKTGQALGSPMFMAPEACRGEEVDQRADIYSFGIVLYMMLTGRAPFVDENLLKVLQMQVSAPLPPPSSLNPELPPALESVVSRALAKDPNDRYLTMEELLFDLEAALPAGSDELLIQAQFGTSNTPFPGTLDRIRSSQRMQRVSASPFNVTGQHNVSPGTLQTAPSLPTAPAKRGRRALLFATLALAIAGAGGYVWYSQQQKATPATADNTVAPTPPAPTPATPPPTAKVAEVPAPAPIVEAPAPTIAEAPADTEEAPAKSKQTNRPARPAKRVAVATAKVPTPKTVTKSAAAVTTTPPAAPAPTPPSGSASVATTTALEPSPPPAPTPAPAPAPMPVPKAAAASPAPAKPVDVGSMDATPSIANLDVNGSLPSSVVRRSVERALPALRACYRAAATAQHKTTPASVSLTFEIDESRAATNVSASGAPFGSLATCAKSAIGRLQTQHAPDVGTVQVVVAIKFTPL